MTRTLKMTFKCSDDDTWTLNLRYAKDGITAQEVQTVMQTIIDHPVFLHEPATIVGAELVEQTVTELV
jgi:hypothetical protein